MATVTTDVFIAEPLIPCVEHLQHELQVTFCITLFGVGGGGGGGYIHYVLSYGGGGVNFLSVFQLLLPIVHTILAIPTPSPSLLQNCFSLFLK